jgi:DMSO/TMAO reductase YedYZ heme-binding membrane subunit
MISILKNYRFRNSKSIHQRNALNLVLFYYILQHNILFIFINLAKCCNKLKHFNY